MAVLVILIFLGGAGLLFTQLDNELAPTEDVGIIQANLSAPEGTSFEAMDRYMLDAQKPMMELLEKGTVRSIIQRTPGGFGPSDDFNSGVFVSFS